MLVITLQPVKLSHNWHVVVYYSNNCSTSVPEGERQPALAFIIALALIIMWESLQLPLTSVFIYWKCSVNQGLQVIVKVETMRWPSRGGRVGYVFSGLKLVNKCHPNRNEGNKMRKSAVNALWIKTWHRTQEKNTKKHWRWYVTWKKDLFWKKHKVKRGTLLLMYELHQSYGCSLIPHVVCHLVS